MNRPILPYMDFSGGLNIETSNENLKNNEMTILQNVDLSSRGSVKRRTGRKKIATIPGKGQGLFFFYRQGQDEPDLIAAISGKLYVKANGSSTFTEIAIKNTDNSTFTFQTSLPVEAVQYRKVLFVATGSKLVEVTWDETTNAHKASVMVPYKPTVLEVINIGTNAIAEDPSTWIQEKEAPIVQIEGVTSSVPQGGVNAAVTFTAHVNKPANINVKYTFSYRKTGAGSFSVFKSDSPDNFAEITFQDIGGYDIQVETKTVVYPIDRFDTTVTGWTNAIKGTQYDSAGGTGCLIVQGSTGNVNDSSLKAWEDLSTPLDMSKANVIEFWWTVFTTSTQSGMNANAIQLKFYTEGNLTTPVLTIGNNGGEWGRGMGGGWNKTTATYNNAIAGLNKIVRVGLSGAAVNSGTYVSNAGPSYTINSNDTTTRIDDIVIYESGTETSYTKSNFQVVGLVDPTVDPETYSAIHTSRMIRLHWDRLILGKDDKYPGQLYISDLNNPRYFPSNKRIDFSLDRQEPITSLVRFQDFLVIFTKTTISTMTGTHPQDGDVTDGREYRVSLINDTLGCIADKSAKVVGNSIIFLSSDGLHSLVPNPYQLQNMEPKKIDFQVKSEVTQDENACSIVHDEQYYICFPSQSKILRLYYNQGGWVKDTSSKLNIMQFAYYNGNVFNLTDNGTIYTEDESIYSDDSEVYDMIVQSKYIDLASSFHYKKLKRLFVLAKHFNDHSVHLFTRVWADGRIQLNPTTGSAEEDETGNVTWQSKTEPNLHFYNSTEFGKWVMGQSILGNIEMSIQEARINGKCKRVRVSFTHNEDQSCEIFGFGIEYKPGKA